MFSDFLCVNNNKISHFLLHYPQYLDGLKGMLSGCNRRVIFILTSKLSGGISSTAALWYSQLKMFSCKKIQNV